MYRGPDQGKCDITVTDSSGLLNTVSYDIIPAEACQQDQIVFKGLTSEVHTVTITTKNTKTGSTYQIMHQGCVEISNTANTYSSGQIVYEVSFDGGATWQDISATDQFTPVAITGHQMDNKCKSIVRRK